MKKQGYFYNLVYLLRNTIGTNIRLYEFYLQFRKINRDYYVKSNYDITIEGYPRSANSYAFHAFSLAQKNSVKIAHHLHVIAQIKKSILLKVPTLVLIRNPVDAVLSNMVAYTGSSPVLLLNYYINYYKQIYKYREKIVIGHFNDVINNFGQIIETINGKYSTNFKPYNPTKSNEYIVKRLIERSNKINANNLENQISKPSKYKQILKSHYGAILRSNKYKNHIKKAYSVYKMLIS